MLGNSCFCDLRICVLCVCVCDLIKLEYTVRMSDEAVVAEIAIMKSREEGKAMRNG